MVTATTELPPIPPKRYFTIGEVSALCGVKPHVLRYWEQEFTQLRPMKRRGNRRYYQHHEVLLIRRIRELLYEQGFTISGARNRLAETILAGSALRQDDLLEELGRAAEHDHAGARFRFLGTPDGFEHLPPFFPGFLSNTARNIDVEHDVQSSG